MSKLKIDKNADFEQVLILIREARGRVFSKANAELVMLYFNVGKMVSQKVNQGIWGDAIVDELAKYIETYMPELTGFNRRGLYRMKQFFETYSNPQFVSTAMAQIETTDNKKVEIVSAVPTQTKENADEYIVTSLLAKISWTNHLEIL